MAFWLFAGLALLGIAIAMGNAFGSALLGWLGADCVFLLVVSVYTSGQDSAARAQY